jgi:excinuclease UvrABC ATPase subunit
VLEVAPREVGQRWLRGERRMPPDLPRRTPRGWLELRGARANNLRGETIRFPLGVLVGILQHAPAASQASARRSD